MTTAVTSPGCYVLNRLIQELRRTTWKCVVFFFLFFSDGRLRDHCLRGHYYHTKVSPISFLLSSCCEEIHIASVSCCHLIETFQKWFGGRRGSSVQEEEDSNVMITVLHWCEYCTCLSTTALSTKQQKAIYRHGEKIMDTLGAVGHYTNFVVSWQGEGCCLVQVIQTFAFTHEIPPCNVWAITRLQSPSVTTVPSER